MGSPLCEGGQEGLEIARGRGFVQTDGERIVGQASQGQARRIGRGQDARDDRCGRVHTDGVEEGEGLDLEAELREAPAQHGCQAGYPFGDRAQPAGAVIDRVHAGHHRQQDLRGADVAGGLLAPDVLLPGLQGHAECGLTLGVLGHADQSPRHLAGVLLARGQERRMGPTVAERDAKTLGAANGHVGADLGGWGEQKQRQQVCRHRHPRPGSPGPRAEGAVVVDGAVRGRVLHQRAEHPAVEVETVRGRPRSPRCRAAVPVAR